MKVVPSSLAEIELYPICHQLDGDLIVGHSFLILEGVQQL
jgi:hypothetical protein